MARKVASVRKDYGDEERDCVPVDVTRVSVKVLGATDPACDRYGLRYDAAAAFVFLLFVLTCCCGCKYTTLTVKYSVGPSWEEIGREAMACDVPENRGAKGKLA